MLFLKNFSFFGDFFFVFVWWFKKKLYLCTRFREATRLLLWQARWSLTTFHTDKQYNVSLVSFWNQRLKSKVRNENTNRQNNLIYIYFRPVQTIWTVDTIFGITDIIYNEEFDPGSGWTLATGLTHASRGVLKELAPERRPAHGWVTRIQPALHIGIAFRKGD